MSLAVLILCGAASVISSEERLEVVHGTFTEEIRPERQVSGGVRAGLFARTNSIKVRVSELRIHLPANPPKSVCVSVSTRDGAYKADAQYDVSGRGPGTYLLDFPTSYHETLEKKGVDEIAVLARLADNCDEPQRSQYAVISWGEVASMREVVVQLNTGLDRTWVSLRHGRDGAEKQRIACSKVAEDERRTIFDTLCVLQVPDSCFGQGSSATQVGDCLEDTVIHRSRNARERPPVKLPISLP